MIFKGSFLTKLGYITVTTSLDKIVTIQFGKKAPSKKTTPPPFYLQAQKQIQEYTEGHRQQFDLPFGLEGTPFQVNVWKAMIQIPFGKKRSYKDLAIQVKSPKAFRAVGGACHRNPLPLIIPCHRVVGSKENLTGFAGGIELKRKLLNLESYGYSIDVH